MAETNVEINAGDCSVDDKVMIKNDTKTDDANRNGISNSDNITDSFKVPEQIAISSFGFKKSSQAIKSNSCKILEEEADKVKKPKPLEKNGESDKNLSDSENFKKKVECSSSRQAKLTVNLPYKEPSWGGCDEKSNQYKLEVIKQGTVIENISLTDKSLIVFGRLPSCDVPMDHPSISRHHAVLQYRVNREDKDINDDDENEKIKVMKNEEESAKNEESSADKNEKEDGWYIYDLDSTHGTWVNKYRLPPHKYIRIRVGHVLKFGGSTRLYIVHGPDTDKESESELNVTELRKLKRETEMARMLEEADQETKRVEKERLERLREENRGCSWGMEEDDEVVEDSEDNDPNAVNPFAELTDESLYIENPKKAIKGFYEREDLEEPEYEFIDDDTLFIGAGFKRRCRLKLPIDGPNGEPLYAEVAVSGKKREAVIACALEACRILDRHGVLRQSHHESRAKKRRKNWAEEDYYDSDDDTYLDRTGDVEKKRQYRMQKVEKVNLGSKVETYDSLKEKFDKVSEEINELEEKLAKDEELKSKSLKEKKEDDDEEEVDVLDAFMKSIKSGGLDVRTKMEMKRKLLELKHQKMRLQSLVALSKPCDIKIIPNLRTSTNLFGKKQNFSKLVRPMREVANNQKNNDKNEEEEEEEDDEGVEREKAKNVVTEVDDDNNEANKNKINEIHRQGGNEREIISQNPAPNLSNSSGDNSTKNVSKTKRKTSSSSQLSVSSVAKKLKEESLSALPAEDGLDYSTWMPPSDQAGDGRTKLNEKYGY
ncbi:hypothetical protein HELRODRAFT_111661 [Helobdella robusta]|uniref:FHA domain-containing protein n=1 Tax=Helobdella robusta TaxID=6412 RepID=T1EFD3_HELRO|nr:hypothetical protein HELRODRAFT_111661 [Helobdella robusta]ESO04654.1 hypothetical protein HELRODRAFT_111661 [Helobdella robusta]